MIAFIALAAVSAATAQPAPMVANTPSSPTAIVNPPMSPPSPYAQIVSPPRLRGAPGSLISPDDYPAAARNAKEQGHVDFTLIVGPNGRVVSCQITRSSGSAVLDATICKLMRRGATFTPAIDSNGNRATAPFKLGFDWRLP